MVKALLFGLLASLIPHTFAGPLRRQSSSPPTVQVINGTIQGTHLASYNQDLFLGIPFAQPPTWALRFRSPVSINKPYRNTLQATRYAPMCVGYGSDSAGKFTSEDCLYLNVIRPAGYEGQNLPVLVWVHSSSFTMGGTSDPRFNLTFIVDRSVKIGKPIIAVSFAYRLAAWGFLASKEVLESGNSNMGIKDQRMAFHWIQENIAAFGGDPSKVTIWGQSSGATSVGYHLLAYNGRDDNLFRAAIMQSGNPTNFISFRDPAEYQLQYNALAATFGCQISFDSLNCLRLIPFPALNAAIILQNTVVSSSYISAWNPIVDGDIIARYGSQQLKEGAFVKVPIIVGATSDEGTVFSPFGIDTATEILSSMSDPSRLCNIPASLAPSALAAYPDEPAYYIPSAATVGNASIPSFFGNNQWRRSAAYWGDAIGVANRRAACEAWAAAGVSAYCFRFNTIVANTPAYIGATHFEDMSYVFDNTQGLGFKDDPFAGLPQANFDLAHLMSGTWASFAYDLDVNAFEGRYPSAVKWPQYEVGNPRDIVWDATVEGLTFVETDDYRKEGIQWINDHALDYKR